MRLPKHISNCIDTVKFYLPKVGTIDPTRKGKRDDRTDEETGEHSMLKREIPTSNNNLKVYELDNVFSITVNCYNALGGKFLNKNNVHLLLKFLWNNGIYTNKKMLLSATVGTVHISIDFPSVPPKEIRELEKLLKPKIEKIKEDNGFYAKYNKVSRLAVYDNVAKRNKKGVRVELQLATQQQAKKYLRKATGLKIDKPTLGGVLHTDFNILKDTFENTFESYLETPKSIKNLKDRFICNEFLKLLGNDLRAFIAIINNSKDLNNKGKDRLRKTAKTYFESKVEKLEIVKEFEKLPIKYACIYTGKKRHICLYTNFYKRRKKDNNLSGNINDLSDYFLTQIVLVPP